MCGIAYGLRIYGLAQMKALAQKLSRRTHGRGMLWGLIGGEQTEVKALAKMIVHSRSRNEVKSLETNCMRHPDRWCNQI